MNLSGQQRNKLNSALNSAFPDKEKLKKMFSYKLERNLESIALKDNLTDIVFNLIETASSEGWVEDLVRAAFSSNPGNPDLEKFF